MADPVTMAAIASFLPEALAAGEIGAGAAAAGMGAEALAAMSPMAVEAGGGLVGALSPVALEQGGGALLQGAVAPGMMDKFGAMIGKYGPKAAGMLANDMQNEHAPQMQPGSPRMNGQQQQAQPVSVDYGGAAQRRPGGGAQMLGINDEELKRLLMSLRGY